MASGSEFFIDTPFFRIAAKSWGDKQAPRVLALHGWLDNLASFEPVAPLLKGIQLVGIDIIGHGLSDHRPPGSIYHFLDAVPHIMSVADALDWKTFSILGHSMGAAMAPLVSGTFPERIEKMALIEGLAPLSRLPDEVPPQLVRHVFQAKELLKKRLPIYTSRDQAIQARKMAGDISLEAAAVLCERGLKEVEGGYTWRADPRLRLESPLRLSEEQVCAFLKRTTCPVLFIEAEQGLKLQPDMMANRTTLLKNLTHKKLSGFHHLHMDTPETVAPLVNAFWSSGM